MLRNSCQLSIEFNKADRQYNTGEIVSGTVSVLANKDCECKGLKVGCLWQTHGRGNRNSGSTSTDILFTGTWNAGEEYRYPFSFKLPNGPCSYHGHLLNVDWYIRAQADIPWALDPREQADFLVAPGELTNDEPYLPGNPRSPYNPSRAKYINIVKSVVLVLFGSTFLFVGLIIAVATIAADNSHPVGLIGLAGAVLGGVVIFFGLRNWLAKIKLGKIQTQIPQQRVSAGEFVDVLIDIPPSSKAHLNSITASLTAKEIVVSGSGTNQTTHRHTLFEDLPRIFEGSENLPLKPGQAAQFTHRYQLPDDAPPSFHASRNNLNWTIEFHVDIARWPDWKNTRPLEVLPVHPLPQQQEVLTQEKPADNTELDDSTTANKDPLW